MDNSGKPILLQCDHNYIPYNFENRIVLPSIKNVENDICTLPDIEAMLQEIKSITPSIPPPSQKLTNLSKSCNITKTYKDLANNSKSNYTIIKFGCEPMKRITYNFVNYVTIPYEPIVYKANYAIPKYVMNIFSRNISNVLIKLNENNNYILKSKCHVAKVDDTSMEGIIKKIDSFFPHVCNNINMKNEDIPIFHAVISMNVMIKDIQYNYKRFVCGFRKYIIHSVTLDLQNNLLGKKFGLLISKKQ